MSLYAKYIADRTDDCILETEQGFATYRFLDPKTCYIIDIFVLSDFRKSGIASAMADSITEIAKERGCQHLLGTVVPSAKNSADSMRVLLAYGMVPVRIEGNMIVFSKEIKEI